MLADTDSKAFQVLPSVEYCQVPLPVLAVMARPLRSMVSISARLAALRIVEAAVAEDVVFSSVVRRLYMKSLEIVGALFLLEAYKKVKFVMVATPLPKLESVDHSLSPKLSLGFRLIFALPLWVCA